MSKKAGAPKVAGEKIYEIGYHIISSVAEENIPAEVAKVKEYLAKENAVIISEEAPMSACVSYQKSHRWRLQNLRQSIFRFHQI